MGEQAWDTGKMRECRNEWSLAADTQLLTYMQQFSQKLLSETHSTLKALDSLESEVATTCVEVSNIGSRFWALSDTQFVENRVYDDDDVISPTSPISAQGIAKEDTENLVIQRLNEAINNGIQVLDSKFEVVQVVSSDSDDDEDSSPHSGVLLKPVNRYKDRPLPHLIGSAEFHSDHTLGLRDLPSDEETDEFMSASDKAYDESEDSDIESDQTKAQDILAHKENTNYRPLGLGLPRVQSQSTVSASNSSLPSGGEAEDDQKRMFSRWQPSDLWAPEDDIPKVVGDNSSNYRPPSADSSVSSAPSSNISEPVKKTSEDFGKSGSGRLPVCVQEDQDLFVDRGPLPVAHLVEPKKSIPAGGVRIFGADINPFPGRNQIRDEGVERSSSKSNQHDRWESDDDSDIFSKAQKPSVKVSSSKDAPPIGVSKKKNVDLFDDDESEDDLFSNKVKSVKPTRDIKSNSMKNVKTPVSMPENSQPTPAMRKSTPFSDVNSQVDEEDDLFSGKGLFSSNKSGLSHNLFTDDLFSSDSSGIFSNTTSSIQKPRSEESSGSSKNTSDSLFSSVDSSNSLFSTSESSAKSNIIKSKKVC
ncbi:WASH complex subunit 2-like [Homalodisca vitripennis]|uniref:WASH complex subunit 2-like n=1 Tax=Homalodisca vitripennis TaxID=197043 RepID=UPI001EEA0769|nr:WASH complex subunit 2-like [Homalodisca vitripennis]